MSLEEIRGFFYGLKQEWRPPQPPLTKPNGSEYETRPKGLTTYDTLLIFYSQSIVFYVNLLYHCVYQTKQDARIRRN